MPPQHIAVLGGGLTGLSSAFHLSRRFPDSQITVLEKEQRLGGWVHSERVDVLDDSGNSANILLEAGPRTLRPNAKSVLELINLLGLEDSLITVPRNSPAAKARFLHIPGSPGILSIPSSIISLLYSPLSSILLYAVLCEPFRRRNRPPGSTDESVDSFLVRRFGEPFARTFGSAFVHGVYAADSRKLSVRAAFPILWEAEESGSGSVVLGFFSRPKVVKKEDYDLGQVVSRMQGVSTFSFQDGIGMLTSALQRYLESKSNVRLLTGVNITSLRLNTDTNSFELNTATGDTFNPTHVVSALPLSKLHAIIHPSTPLPHLNANPSSSVTVVNLVFPSTPERPIHPPGFGYLIPRPPTDYGPQNSGILGVVFDSCVTSAQDADPQGRFVKLTVMMGGPHPITPADTATSTVLQHLASQLSATSNSPPVSLPEPVFCKVHNHHECIPTLTIGHLDRMKELSATLESEPWKGRLEVVGAGVGGVSVGDCVEAGRTAGKNWV